MRRIKLNQRALQFCFDGTGFHQVQKSSDIMYPKSCLIFEFAQKGKPINLVGNREHTL